MRDYGKVFSRFWTSEDIRALSDQGRLLALYLLTCEHGTLAGIFRLPDGYVCEDMQWSPERVTEGFEELLRKGFATRCERTKWVWITKYLEWNEPENPNQLKAAAKIFTRVPDSCHWRTDFAQVFQDLASSLVKGSRNPSTTVSKSGSGSGSGSGTGTGTGTGHTDAVAGKIAGDPPDAASGECVSRGDGCSKPNGKGKPRATNGHGGPPTPTPPAPDIEPHGFATLRAVYPERAGDQRWSDALIGYTENVQAGYSEQEMLDGVMRYARYCTAEGITGTKFVQAAHTFLGTGHAFTQAWKPSEKPKRESTGERWLREKEAEDANR